MSYRNVRQTFLNYFKKHDHKFVPSSLVVPQFHDKSCLFVNAGMFQFKNILLGSETVSSEFSQLKRAVNSQKCVRISGKHNDLNDVGKDGHHHTFFEMLGNWSFGDYFNEEACHMALDLLVNEYGLPLDRLYFTFFGGGMGLRADLNTRDIWISLGVPTRNIIETHLTRDIDDVPLTDNFWEMGSTGPCGLCTEIFYDVSGHLSFSNRRFVPKEIDNLEEVWNIVMIKFNRLSQNKLVNLPVNHIDTGMGFERLVKILEGKKSNYETSLFEPLLNYLQSASSRHLEMKSCVNIERQAFQIVLDHLRCLTIAVTDGASFSAGGRGPPLKQLMKRSIWFSENVLGIDPIDWHVVVSIMVEIYDDIFPEIGYKKESTVNTLIKEMEKSKLSLYSAEEKMLKEIKKNSLSVNSIRVLYDAHGLPLEVARAISEKHKTGICWEDVLKIQTYSSNPSLAPLPPSTYPDLHHMYPQIKSHLQEKNCVLPSKIESSIISLKGVKVLCAIQDFEIATTSLKSGIVSLVFDRTAFYPAQKGHSSDMGSVSGQNNFHFDVQRVEEMNDIIIHHGVLKENIDLSLSSSSERSDLDELQLFVDPERRLSLARAHTSVIATIFCLAQELGIRNCDLGVKDYQVGCDRAILHIEMKEDLDFIVPKNVAEAARACSQFVALSYVKMIVSELDSAIKNDNRDVIFLDKTLSPFHKKISYPTGTFIPTNAHYRSLDPSNTSDCPSILSSSPFLPKLNDINSLQIVDFTKSKSNVYKIYITSGPIAIEVEKSMGIVRSKLFSDIYKLPTKSEQLSALKEIVEGKVLPYRFKWLLKAKKTTY